MLSCSQLYTQYLCDAFLIHKVHRYDLEGKRLFEIGEKYYFENLGIRNALWGYRIEDLGKIYENVVYNHLLTMGYQVKIGIIGGNKEIDFIAERKGEKLYIQVALVLENEKTIEREFGNLLKVKDNYPKMIITSRAFPGNTYKGIEIVQLKHFLMSTSLTRG
jgi:predicted AAA+ superfamily ATPase